MKTKDDNELFDDNGILRDGARLRTPMYAMDSVQKSIRDATHPHPSHHKPGYRFVTDSEAKQRIDDAHEAYRQELSNRWRTNDQGEEGDACEAPGGVAGVLKFASGRLVCVPRDAAKTSDRKLLDEGWDAGDDREQAYIEYDQMLRDAWRSK